MKSNPSPRSLSAYRLLQSIKVTATVATAAARTRTYHGRSPAARLASCSSTSARQLTPSQATATTAGERGLAPLLGRQLGLHGAAKIMRSPSHNSRLWNLIEGMREGLGVRWRPGAR